MKIGPRYKVCKRLGSSVYEKCQTQKYTLAEAKKGTTGMGGKRPSRLSDYGKQLIEKQRARLTYGMTEKQFARYVADSTKRDGEATVTLLSRLERRLDNIIYRLGFAPTRRAARQMVVHGHVLVNKKKAAIPSHILEIGDSISLRSKSKTDQFNEEFKVRANERSVPTWLTLNVKKVEGELKSLPTRDTTDAMFDLSIVMEYYSR